MATANTKLTVDTSQAMMAINGLNTAWVNASAQMNVMGKALDFIASKWDYLNKTINDSATFMDAVKNEAGVASVQMAMSVTEGQIKPMELARQQNVLMQGSLKLTQDQFDLVAKSAVALADATGQDANQAFADLSRSLVSGTTRSLSQFGIQIEDGGTKAERTARIMAHLSQQYGGYSVEVTNASDATAKMNSQMELQQMLAARSLDKVSQRLSQFKTFYFTEFVPSIIDAFAGTRWSMSAQIIDGIKAIEAESEKLDRAAEARNTEAGAARARMMELEKSAAALRNESRKNAIEDELANLKNLRQVAEDMNKKYGVSEKRLALIQEYGSRSLALQKELLTVGREDQKNADEYQKNYSARLDAGAKAYHLDKESLDLKKQTLGELEKQDRMQQQTGQFVLSHMQINERILAVKGQIAFQEKELADRAKNVDFWSNALADTFTNRVLPGIKSAVDLFAQVGIGGNSESDKARQARLEREQREREQKAEKDKASGEAAQKALDDLNKKANEDYKKWLVEKQELSDQSELEMLDSYADFIKKRGEIQWAGILKEVEDDEARAIRKDEARGEQIIQEAERVAKKEADIKKKAMDDDLAARKEYVAKSKELVEGLAAVSINAIFAEKKAREGLSRTDYVLKQLAAYMKGEALKYAAKSLGYLAEGIAATFWNPPAAAAAFKASAVSAAASVAFGGGAVAAGAMGGNAKSSSASGSSSSSKTPQRETMAGTTMQRTEVTVILGGRGVVIGDQDELARTISNLLGSANRRGVTRG